MVDDWIDTDDRGRLVFRRAYRFHNVDKIEAEESLRFSEAIASVVKGAAAEDSTAVEDAKDVCESEGGGDE